MIGINSEEKEFYMSLAFDVTQYKINTLALEENTLSYRAYEHIPYVAKPVAPEFQ